MYASEVAIYKVVADILNDTRGLVLPPITLSFPTWVHNDCLRESRKVEIEDINFSVAISTCSLCSNLAEKVANPTGI